MLQRVKWLSIFSLVTGAAAIVAGALDVDAAVTIPGGLLSVAMAIMSRDSG